MCYFKAKFHENVATQQNCTNPIGGGGGGGGKQIVFQTICTSVTYSNSFKTSTMAGRKN